jgi:hypothetical protein
MLETFAALADPSRLRIVELLRDGPRPVGSISAALRLNQPQVSKHLRVLKSGAPPSKSSRAHSNASTAYARSPSRSSAGGWRAIAASGTNVWINWARLVREQDP